MKKKELRNLYKEKRKTISIKDKLIWDDLLLIQFQKFNVNNVRTVFSYWPIKNENEPNTHLFTRYLKHLIPDFRLTYPVSNFTSNKMKAILVKDESDFNINAFGIVEPKNGVEINPNEIDLVIVPMLVCDKLGNRIGFGKGFYDRFLVHCNKEAIKISFSYYEPIDKIEDISAFDVPLNFCITPQHIYEF